MRTEEAEKIIQQLEGEISRTEQRLIQLRAEVERVQWRLDLEQESDT